MMACISISVVLAVKGTRKEIRIETLPIKWEAKAFLVPQIQTNSNITPHREALILVFERTCS
jgi:hypothetical protein